ncbi:hypothetical protein ACEQPO_16275 [Bacillus sp. SL00103]
MAITAYFQKESQGLSLHRSIESFGVQEAGVFDQDTGMLFVTSSKVFELDFSKETDLNDVRFILTKHLADQPCDYIDHMHFSFFVFILIDHFVPEPLPIFSGKGFFVYVFE